MIRIKHQEEITLQKAWYTKHNVCRYKIRIDVLKLQPHHSQCLYAGFTYCQGQWMVRQLDKSAQSFFANVTVMSLKWHFQWCQKDGDFLIFLFVFFVSQRLVNKKWLYAEVIVHIEEKIIIMHIQGYINELLKAVHCIAVC